MWRLSNSGELQYSATHQISRAIRNVQRPMEQIQKNIDIPSIYVNSSNDVLPGHIVTYTQNPSIIHSDSILDTFDHTAGLHYATPSVEEGNGTIAGVVIDNVAKPDDNSWTHANSFTSQHAISGHENILRVAPRGIILAWVIDDHENTFNGIYEKSINGTNTGQAVIRNIDDEYFSIEAVGNDLANEVANLKEKFDTLTSGH